MPYTIITENDISQWKDKTGEEYHFPSRYQKYLTPGTNVICYKGQLKDPSFKNKRLTGEPHYFGMATIEAVFKDQKSSKNDFYAKLKNYIPFAKPVLAKQSGEFLEKIPASRLSNYWRDGVRAVDKDIFNKIIELSDINENKDSELSDIYQGLESSFESTLLEGKKKLRFTSYYERRREYRQQALLIHGYTCMGCNLNFEEKYGKTGKGFIHVHHVKPVSETGETIINPQTDLIVLCPNCHSMVHRQRNNTLNLDQLKAIIKTT